MFHLDHQCYSILCIVHSDSNLLRIRFPAEVNRSDPTQYLLTLEQMIENDYPIPSYMADVFEKPPGWLETPKPSDNESKWKQKLYAIDCEMVILQFWLLYTRPYLYPFLSVSRRRARS